MIYELTIITIGSVATTVGIIYLHNWLTKPKPSTPQTHKLYVEEEPLIYEFDDSCMFVCTGHDAEQLTCISEQLIAEEKYLNFEYDNETLWVWWLK